MKTTVSEKPTKHVHQHVSACPSHAAPSTAVLIPAYNAVRTIRPALESIRKQTRTPDEVIVVDDGSEDETAEYARQHMLQPTVLSIAHAGQSNANNTGATHASSDYIAYLDADDRWHEHKLEIFNEIAKVLECPGVIISDFRRCELETGQQSETTNADMWAWIRTWPAQNIEVGQYRVRIFDPAAAVEALCKGYPIYPSALSVRRDLLENIGGWSSEFQRCCDFDLGLRLVAREGIVFIDEALTTVYRHGGHGTSYAYIARQMEWDLKILDKHASIHGIGKEYRSMARRYRSLRTIFRGDLGCHHDRYLDAARWYLVALVYPRQWPRVIHRLGMTAYGLFRDILSTYWRQSRRSPNHHSE